MQQITIGTRGSRLALAQSTLVAEALQHARAGISVELKVITTKGDINQSPIPLDTVGKAWFTEEIEQALVDGDIDMAVHSLKDLPPEQTSGLVTVTVLKRANPSDVLVSKTGASLNALPPGAVIGTDSIRRKALILERRPDLVVNSIRGNIDTRLKKLREEAYDGIVIAAAGLERMGLIGEVTEFFDPTVFLPAPGQGVLAAQVREHRQDLLDFFQLIQDEPTRIAAEAEQAFSQAIGGGCKSPVGCYARVQEGVVEIHGMTGDAELRQPIKKAKTSGPVAEAVALAKALAVSFV